MSQFYKFVCDIAAVRNIIKGNIKFTPPEELNDPAELLPIMSWQEVSGSLKILREKGFSEVQFQWLKNQYAILRLLSPETLTSIARRQSNKQIKFCVQQSSKILTTWRISCSARYR